MKRLSLLIASCVLFGGCTLGPDYQTTSPSLPEQWQSVEGASVFASAAPQGPWWHALKDSVLEELLAQALAQNLDLQQAQARLEQVRGRLAQVRGENWPDLNLSGQAYRERYSSNGPEPMSMFPGVALDQSGFRLGFGSHWEIDLFGGRQRRIEQSEALFAAEQARWHGVRLTVMAAVADHYFRFRGLQHQLQLLQRNIALQNETVTLVERQLEAGLISRFDLERALAQRSRTQAREPLLHAQLVAQRYALETWLGQWPGTLAVVLDTPQTLPTDPAQLPVGLPAQLLQNRPDLMLAERQLAAASAAIGVAEAARYPKLSLTGRAGLSAGLFGDWIREDSNFHALSVGLDWPLFAGGALKAEVAVAEAALREQQAHFQQTLLLALEDSQRALVHYGANLRTRDQLREAAARSAEVVRLARVRYTQGAEDFLAVLNAEQALLEIEDQLAQQESAVLQALVTLYKALGGGWQQPAEEPPAG